MKPLHRRGGIASLRRVLPRLRTSTVAAFVVAGLGTAACGTDFDPVTRVTDFRLIAVGADKPYASPGEEVALTTLYHEPFGRPIQWAWTTCLNPDDSTVNACLLSLAAKVRAGQTPAIATAVGMDRFTWKVPDDALSSLPEAARPGAMAGILTIACPGTIRIDPLGETSSSTLPFHCVEAGTGVELPYERFVVSVKRVFLRGRDKNANPALEGIDWDGRPWLESEVHEVTACKNDTNTFDDCDGGEEHLIAARTAPGADEQGVDEYGTPFTEQVVVQNYATEGTFEFEAKTAESARIGGKWVARNSARGREVTMWFVARDNRGGVSWTSRRVRVRP